MEGHQSADQSVQAPELVTAAHMVHPKLADGSPDMLIAGNDETGKKSATIVH